MKNVNFDNINHTFDFSTEQNNFNKTKGKSVRLLNNLYYITNKAELVLKPNQENTIISTVKNIQFQAQKKSPLLYRIQSLLNPFSNAYKIEKLSQHILSFAIEKKKEILTTKITQAKVAGPSLIELDLSGSFVTNQQLKEIFTACPNIKKINISNCSYVTSASFSYLPKGVTDLNLKSLDLSEQIKKVFERCPDIQKLNLAYCKNISIIANLELPQGLKKLNLSGLSVVNFIKSWPSSLERLDLASTEITNEAIASLPPKLKALDLYRADVDGDLENLPTGLEHLNLAWTSLKKDAKIESLPKSLRHLNIFQSSYDKPGEVAASYLKKNIDEILPHLIRLEINSLDQSRRTWEAFACQRNMIVEMHDDTYTFTCGKLEDALKDYALFKWDYFR